MPLLATQGPHLDRILKACEPGLSDGALNALLNQAATAHEVEETILQPHILCKGCSSLCTDVLSKAPGADSWVSTIGKSVGPTVLYKYASSPLPPPGFCAGLALFSTDLSPLPGSMTASVGQKNLHNAVLGHCLQIIALSRFRLYSAATESEAYRWKMQALARLHVGAILYLCMRVVGAGRLAAHPTQDSFSLWYGCVFHPLVEWEQKRGTMLARTPLRDICAFGSDDTDFACASLFGSSATTLYTENTVQDLLKRIADLAEAYRFVLDPPRSKPSQQGSSRSTEYYESCCINESVSIFASPRIQWVPACILFGVKGHHLLRRLETSSRVSLPFPRPVCVHKNPFSHPPRRAASPPIPGA